MELYLLTSKLNKYKYIIKLIKKIYKINKKILYL